MDVNRRDFFKIVGVGGTAAAMVGCGAEPPETLVPYLIPPEEIVPGKATWYATVCRECPAGCGILAKTVEGRAVKVEGNPDHPVSRGGICARGQASLQGLYNPDRIRQPLRRKADGTLEAISWEEGERLLAEHLAALKGRGERIAFVTPLLTGSLDRLIEAWLAAVGGRRIGYEAIAYEAQRAASRLAFGLEAIPFYDLESARIILSFGADFLETWLSPVEHARQFAAMRTYREGRIGRSAYIGPRLSLTGANADEWIAARPGTEGLVALGMLHTILAERLASPPGGEEEALRGLTAPFPPAAVAERAGVSGDKIRVLARAFARKRPSLALGDGRGMGGTATCLAVHLLNYVVGNVGQTVRFGPTAAVGRLSAYREMRDLLLAMEGGKISLLLLSGVNPLFTLPEAARFQEALRKVSLVVSFASFPDETAVAAHLVLPEHTFLEAWGDHEPWDGVRGLQQPVMRPLYETRSLGDVLLAVAKRLGLQRAFPWDDFGTYLREQWREAHQRSHPAEDFEAFWAQTLQRGGLFTPVASRPVRLNAEALRHRFVFDAPAAADPKGLTVIPYPSAAFYDGRMANRPWLQELPDPLTQIVWDNWVEVHPEDARRLGLAERDVLRLESGAGRVELPAHLSGGVRPGSVAVPVGQGHTAFGRYAAGRGANPLSLLPAEPEAASGGLPWIATRVTVKPTGRRHALVSVAGSDRPHDREIIQSVPLAALQGGRLPTERPHLLQIYPEHPHPHHRWGMVIDLNACIGCGGCVTACYAENNIPIVGKEQVGRGREMSWIRVQRVNEGEPDQPEHRFLPMLCQHCDSAPCEPVCPVYATYHNPDGLNVQVYNRCVGTKYCSNNCPYKVRRFNWFPAAWPEPLHLQLNPDVTVRTMGVMEKCTFCVQRIQSGKLAAKAEGRAVRDGEIVPACAQACPTRAIVFGDLKDPGSEVSRLANDPRRYRVLEPLNTRPAITYLKKIVPGPVEG